MNIHQYIHEQVPDVLSNIHQTSQACIFCINTFLKKQKTFVHIKQKSHRLSIESAKTLIKKYIANSFAKTFKNQW